jgi:hypothetical protein
VIRIEVRRVSGDIKKNMAYVRDRMNKAITASANMLTSMMRDQFKANIASSDGKLGTLSEGLTVVCTTSDLRATIETFHDRPYAGIFEEGGQITGDLLWVPLSGTDAEGVQPKEYPGGLFSIKRESSGRPLLFSIADKKPKYFGIEAVTIPPKWNLRGIQASVLANYRELYDAAYKSA